MVQASTGQPYNWDHNPILLVTIRKYTYTVIYFEIRNQTTFTQNLFNPNMPALQDASGQTTHGSLGPHKFSY